MHNIAKHHVRNIERRREMYPPNHHLVEIIVGGALSCIITITFAIVLVI